MAASDRGDRFVLLRGGMVVPAPAYVLLVNLEARGFTIRAEGSSTLLVQPAANLTPEDRTAIRRWKWHLLMLLDYCQQPNLDAHLFTDRPTRQEAQHV